MSDPGFVQVNAPGSGPKISTVEVDESIDVDSFGNAQADDALQQQVVTLADKRGGLVNDRTGRIVGLLEEILEQLQELNMNFK